MVDLLKTSVLVTVTVIPPLLDGSPRRYDTLSIIVACRFIVYYMIIGFSEVVIFRIVPIALIIVIHQKDMKASMKMLQECLQ